VKSKKETFDANQPCTSATTIRRDAEQNSITESKPAKRQKKIKNIVNIDPKQQKITSLFKHGFKLFDFNDPFKKMPSSSTSSTPSESSAPRHITKESSQFTEDSSDDDNFSPAAPKPKRTKKLATSSDPGVSDSTVGPVRKHRYKKPLEQPRGFSLCYKDPPRRTSDKKGKPQFTPKQQVTKEKFIKYYARMMQEGVDVLAERDKKKVRGGGKVMLKEVGNDLDSTYVAATVQCGMAKLFKSQMIARKYMPLVKGDVEYVSRQIRLFLLYMSCLIRENRDKPEFFQKLSCNSLLHHYKDMNDGSGKSLQFATHCRDNGINAMADGTNRCYIIKNALVTVWSNMLTTIRLNTKRAMKVYFNFIDPVRREKEPAANLRYVEQVIAGTKPNPWGYDFGNEIRTSKGVKKEHDVQRIPMLLKIQETIRKAQIDIEAAGKTCPKGLRTHAVIPEGRYGLIHVQYDTGALVELMNQEVRAHNLKKEGYRGVNPIKSFDYPKDVIQARARFNRIINYRQFEKWDDKLKPLPLENEDGLFSESELRQLEELEGNHRIISPVEPEINATDHITSASASVKKIPRDGPKEIIELRQLRKKFSLFFSTNGIEASVHFLRKDRPLKAFDTFQKSFGIDPGYKVFSAMTVIENGVFDEKGKELFKNIKCSAKSWHHLTGFNFRKIILEKIYGDVEKLIAGEREQLLSGNIDRIFIAGEGKQAGGRVPLDYSTGHATLDHDLYVHFKLRHFELKQETYDKSRKYLRLGWQKKMAVRQRLDRISERLVPKGCITSVYYGDGPMTSSTGG
jgi:hypothetical protein